MVSTRSKATKSRPQQKRDSTSKPETKSKSRSKLVEDNGQTKSHDKNDDYSICMERELGDARAQISDLRKNVASLTSQLSEALTEKHGLSRKFWDLVRLYMLESVKLSKQQILNGMYTCMRE